MNTSSTILIRLANADDIPALISLSQQAPTAARWTDSQYRELLHPAEGVQRFVFVAQPSENGAVSEICGFLVAQGVASQWELENMVVDFNSRRKGAGQRLLEALFNGAREAGGEAVFLEVRESNLGARKLYEKAGFAEVGRRKSYYINPLEDAIVYRRSLL